MKLKTYVDKIVVACQGANDNHLDKMKELILASNRVFICGNGGSAATASHMACDLSKTTGKYINAIALTDNVALLTAIGNDLSYDDVFREQLIPYSIGPNDLLIVITASGNSKNIVRAVTYAKECKTPAFALLGFNGGVVRSLVPYLAIFHSDDYGVIEDAHAAFMHALTFNIRYDQ